MKSLQRIYVRARTCETILTHSSIMPVFIHCTSIPSRHHVFREFVVVCFIHFDAASQTEVANLRRATKRTSVQTKSRTECTPYVLSAYATNYHTCNLCTHIRTRTYNIRTYTHRQQKQKHSKRTYKRMNILVRCTNIHANKKTSKQVELENKLDTPSIHSCITYTVTQTS